MRIHRPAAQLTDDGKSPAVGIYNHFGDRQPHARAWMQSVPLVLAAIEFFKNQRLLEGIDAGAAVGHAEFTSVIGLLLRWLP